jgi:hypothetical protein
MEQITLAGTGTYLIQAMDTDLAGNVGSSAISTFALDNQILAPANQFNVAGRRRSHYDFPDQCPRQRKSLETI